ncbi:OmpA family protein [Pseudoroseicyclus sp. H15]
MRHVFLKTSTALALALTGAPVQLAAQDAGAAPDCGIDEPVLPCIGPNGTLIETQDDFRAGLEELGVTGDAADEIISRIGTPEVSSGEDMPGEPADGMAGEGADAVAESVDNAVTDEPVADAATDETAAEVADELGLDEGNSEDAMGMQPDVTAGAAVEDESAAEDAASDTADAMAEGGGNAIEQAAEETDMSDTTPESEAEMPEEVTAGAAVADDEAAIEAADNTEQEAASDSDMSAEEVADELELDQSDAGEAVDSEATAEEGMAPTADDSEMADESADAPESEAEMADEVTAGAAVADDEAADAAADNTAAGEDDAAAEEANQAQEEADEAAAAEAAGASAAASVAADESIEGEVTTETVEEDDVRRADEDFDTAPMAETMAPATGDDAAPADESADAEVDASAEDEDEGLTNFQKALILGLGAVAVGSVLNNGDEVVSNSGDRVVVNSNGELRVLKNDDALLRTPGSEVQTETFNDGSTRTTVTRADGSQVVTIRAADGTALRRTLISADGTRTMLFDDTAEIDPVTVSALPAPQLMESTSASSDEAALRAALTARIASDVGRTFSLRQVREIRAVRALAPQVEIDAITFETGSAAIQPSQADEITDLGLAISSILEEDPGQVFLIEGHTDAVGDAAYNLALSDRRAETVALALSQYFDVPPENLVTQGYGESDLKVETSDAERQNRRAAVRNITGLLRGQI